MIAYLAGTLAPAWASGSDQPEPGPSPAPTPSPAPQPPAARPEGAPTSSAPQADAQGLYSSAQSAAASIDSGVTADALAGSSSNQPSGLPLGSEGSTALPGGAGTVGGLGESFVADLATGTSTFKISIDVPTPRGTPALELALAYSSGAGSGVAGMGWSIGYPYIARKTDAGPPTYDDRAEFHPGQDTFVFNGGELVPLGAVHAGKSSHSAAGEVLPGWAENWQYFRSKNEGGYQRFFWSPDHRTWRVQAGQSGITLELGVPLRDSGDTNAIEENLEQPSQSRAVFRWNLARMYSAHGSGKPTEDANPTPYNPIVFRYSSDGGLGYPVDVYDTPPVGAPNAPLDQYAHHTRLVWEERPDTIQNYRRGYLVSQRLRLKRIDVTSKRFVGPVTQPRKQLRRYHLEYDATSSTSLLSKVTEESRCSGSENDAAVPAEVNGQLPGVTNCPTYPPIRLQYSRTSPVVPVVTPTGYEPFDAQMRTVENSPSISLEPEKGALTVDVNGDGLPDVLDGDATRNNGAHKLFLNGGASGPASFASGILMPTTPAIEGLRYADGFDLSLKSRHVAPLDYDSDGILDLVLMTPMRGVAVFSPTASGGYWHWTGRWVPKTAGASVDLSSIGPNARIGDVNGDGLVDVLASTGSRLLTYLSLAAYPGGDGLFGSAKRTGPSTAALSQEPLQGCVPASNGLVEFSDARVRLTDVNGDGLLDIAKVMRGSVVYFPGRGNGQWGTGDASRCAPPQYTQPVQMQNSPFARLPAEELQFGDVNGDGFADLVGTEGTALKIWLNQFGTRFSDEITIPRDPRLSTGKGVVTVTDINGSGTADVVFGDPGNYKYIDLLGGARPFLLTGVQSSYNKNTEIVYATTTTERQLAAAAGRPWAGPLPMVLPLVKRVIVRDNLERIGRVGTTAVTEYAYQEPAYDRTAGTFRGFGDVTLTPISGADAPAKITRTRFHTGRCEDEATPGRCADRSQANLREHLIGKVRSVDTLDSAGKYLYTAHTTYRIRTLYTGADGAEVRAIFKSAQDSYGYETTPYVANEETVNVVDVEQETTSGLRSETSPLRLYSRAGRVHLRQETDVDLLGHEIEQRDLGCVEGCAVADEVLITHTDYQGVPGDLSGWMFGPADTYKKGSIQQEPRDRRKMTYDSLGHLVKLTKVLSGTLPLKRSHAVSGAAIAPNPAEASVDGDIVDSELIYDAYGHVTELHGANHRCQLKGYDSVYAELPLTQISLGGTLGTNGCGQTSLVVTSTFDRGLQTIVSNTDVAGRRGGVTFDTFGRVIAVFGPNPDVIGDLAPLPERTFEYTFGTEQRPVSVIRGRTLTSGGVYTEAFTLGDSLGRLLANVTQADPAAGDEGAWVVSGVVDYDSLGRTVRSYRPWFWNGDPRAFDFSIPPPSKFESVGFDSFGRTVDQIDAAGVVKMRTVYHAITEEIWDGEDLSTTSVHTGTFATQEHDGHGRVIRSTQRIRESGQMQVVETKTEYLPTGEVTRITRAKQGVAGQSITRWVVYDSLGRMVLNAEPNVTPGFTEARPTILTAVRAPRYAYNDSGQVVGTSDGRGCGANITYDALGRPVSYDYSPCEASQPTYSAPDLQTGVGAEILYRYDSADPELSQFTSGTDAGKCAPYSGSWLGLLSSVSTLGMKSIDVPDAKGRPVCSARRVAVPGAGSSSLATRYAPRWYVQKKRFDEGNRLIAQTTGAQSMKLLGAGGKSEVTATYTRRGVLANVGGSYGSLVASQRSDASGRLKEMVFGDAASTTTLLTYDDRNRPSTVWTGRTPPPLWSSSSSTYPRPNSSTEPTTQTTLAYADYVYDQADNPVEIVDRRDGTGWPAGSKPATRRMVYDDFYRVTEVNYSYPGSAATDAWTSPLAPEVAGTDKRPGPHVVFASRVTKETFKFDWNGNISSSDDNEHGFYDRSIGTQTHGTVTSGPYQLSTASNRSIQGSAGKAGDLVTRYDSSGNLVGLKVTRDGSCLPSSASCVQRFEYTWNEVGELVKAKRWDLVGTERTVAITAAPPARAPEVVLDYAYHLQSSRVLKSATANGVTTHDAFIFGSLELQSALFLGGDYELTERTELVRLSFEKMSLGRVEARPGLPEVQAGSPRVLLVINDHLGSPSIVLEKGSGELVERIGYLSYGQADYDYRPARWGSYREPVRFTSKVEDTEVGLIYGGKRYLSPYLKRWISPDPRTVHGLAADPNLYAYVSGRTLAAVDPNGEFLIIPILVGIAVAAAINATAQVIRNGGFDNFNWVEFTFAAAAGGVTGGVGAWLGAATVTVSGTPLLISGAAGGATYGVGRWISGGSPMDVLSGAVMGGLGGWFGLTYGGGTLGGLGYALGQTAGQIAATNVAAGIGQGIANEVGSIKFGEKYGTVGEAVTLYLAGSYLGGAAGGVVDFARVGALAGGVNGIFAGARGIYDWNSYTGYVAFLSDSTWGLIGTSLGDVINVVHFLWADYDSSLSYRQNRQVYHDGLWPKQFAHTQGNTTINLQHHGTPLLNHESWHIFQNRLFGPTYTLSYAGWLLVAGIGGGTYAGFNGDNVFAGGQHHGYFCNPWERWSYDTNNESAGQCGK